MLKIDYGGKPGCLYLSSILTYLLQMTCRNSRDEMFAFGGKTFTTESVGSFFEALRSIGMEGKYQLPRHEDVRQYVICGVFTHEEIESKEQNRHIKAMSDHLLKLDAENKDGKYRSKFICKGRLAVLLNNFGRHGEARLFDPDGTILRELGVISEENEREVFESHRHLDIMKERFVKEFGDNKQQFIALFSHLIPCTVENHMCSKLLKEYADKTNEYIIVSYDNCWNETNTKQALQYLREGNIHVVKPRERRTVVNKEINSIQRNIGSNIKRQESCENEQLTELESGTIDNVFTTNRQRRREKNKPYFMENEKSSFHVRGRKRNTLVGYRRQNSKGDRNKLWD